MQCISINYRHVGEDIRSVFAFPAEVQQHISDRLTDRCGIREIVVLCTCNRTELYFCGGSAEDVFEMLAECSGMETGAIKDFAMLFCGRSATVHLFRVSCGVESMVIGEDEILRQVRQAYRNACTWGTVHHELHVRFQAAFACAKKIKTETALSNVSVSTATLATNAAANAGSHVLVIGASGQIGQTTVRNLLSHRHVCITATLRRHTSGILQTADERIRTVPYEERYAWMDEADCILSATSSPHYTITETRLAAHLHTPRQRLFIDLAVPPDIDRHITALPGVSLFGIDHFQQLAADNNVKKAHSAELAGKRILTEADETEKALAFQAFLSGGQDSTCDLHTLYQLKATLTAEQFIAVLHALKGE